MKYRISVALAAILLIVVPQFFIDSEVYARTVSIAGICLLLWISEIVPAFVPSLLLWTLVPTFLSPFDGKFTFTNTLSWAVDPVMALFFGGFVLGVATESSGLDRRLTQFALRSSGDSFEKFLLSTMLSTALLSMWMSNIAAAALVFACLNPILCKFDSDHILRRALLLAVAFGADFGGIATPIGTGPNAIAIASISATQSVSFFSWMGFALPLTVGLLFASYLLLSWRVRRKRSDWTEKKDEIYGSVPETESVLPKYRQTSFLIILAGTIILWLSEPLHGIPAAVIALGSAATLFLSGVLSKNDLARVDWSTLLLIAGGITLGRLLEHSGVVKTLAATVPFADFDPRLSLFLLCLASALLSALMSNTATAVMLIPLASVLIPSPSTAILIAVSASFGVPFLISTPPNAMAFGQGGLKFTDLFWPGLLLMLFGCVLVSLTGKSVLQFVGIP